MLNISITIEQSIAENPLNCWEALQVMLKVISSQAFYKRKVQRLSRKRVHNKRWLWKWWAPNLRVKI